MPVPTHLRMTVRGIFVGTEETWSNVFHFDRTNTAEPDAGTDDVNSNNISAAVAGMYGAGYISPLVEVSDWRIYVIGTNGKMEGNAPLMKEYAASELRGGGGSTKYPPQIAVACSTLAENRGAAQFGRFYLPGPTAGIGSDFRLSTGDAIIYQQMAVTFLKAVADSIDLMLTTSATAVHVSKGPPGSSVGTIQEVKRVRVGRVLDTLHSRRRSLEEDYQVSGVIDW